MSANPFLIELPRRLVSAAAVLALSAMPSGCRYVAHQTVRGTDTSRYHRPLLLDDGWQVTTPEEVGLARAPLERLTSAVRRGEYPNVHAVLIAKDGRLVYEEYFEGRDRRDRTWPVGHNVTVPVAFHRDSLHDLRSAGKSIAAALVGIALGSGAIRSLDTPIVDYFPEHATLATPGKRRITLRHALTMTGGLDWNESDVSREDSLNHEKAMARSPDPAGFVLARPLAAEPGSRWYYNAGLSTLLGYVVSRASGLSLGAFARERLFEPLGITTVEWGGPMAWRDIPELHWPSTEPWAKVATPTGELWMRARDLLKVGWVHVDGGRWRGKQLIPAEWARQSIQPHVATGSSEFGEGITTARNGYGYQWWHKQYRLPFGELSVSAAQGNGGQRLWAVPQLRLAVLHFAGNYNMIFSGWEADRLLLERVIPWAMGIETAYRHPLERTVRLVAPGEWPFAKLTGDQRAVYAGIYDERAVNAVNSYRTEVWDENGMLRMTLPGGGAIDLIPEGNHVFAAGRVEHGTPRKIYWADERVVFVLHQGAVVRFEWRNVGSARAHIIGTRVR